MPFCEYIPIASSNQATFIALFCLEELQKAGFPVSACPAQDKTIMEGVTGISSE
jgi:hypothetical protein